LTATGNNANGGTETASFNLSCGTFLDQVRISYYYNTTYGTQRNYTFYYPINQGNYSSNYTFINVNKNNPYGLGEFEKLIVLTLVLLFVCGTALLVGGSVVALVLAIFVMGYFSAVGFISVYYLVIPIVIAVFYIMGTRR
jgi:hypothetical protein